MTVQNVRLAAVSYLNTRPLVAAFETNEISGYDVIKDLPSRLPAMIESKKSDIGLLPVGYCVRHPELELARGSGIACHGAVHSILLITRNGIGNVSRIATTNSSISSVALLKILLQRHFKSGAMLASSGDPITVMQADKADGALLIGDQALQFNTAGYQVYDLGLEWLRFTGLPFVFALWAGPDESVVKKAEPDLVQAMNLGRQRIPELAKAAARGLDLSPAVCEDYLKNSIVHAIGDAEMEGYNAFRRLLLNE